MSKRRLIPKLQLKTSSFDPNRMVLVITRQFNDVTEIGDAISQSKIFQDQGADELIFINIDRTDKEITKLSKIIGRVSEEIFMPITVGGGVSSEEHFRILLNNGADKISINTHAFETPDFIAESSKKYGAQCVVVSIDYKLNKNGKYRVFINNGQTETSKHPIEWAIECEKLGAGEILLTSIDKDGMNQGLDLEITAQITKSLRIPIIASGGCSFANHFIDGYLIGNADAVAAGSFFAHRDQNFMQTRAQIRNAGVNIRVYS
jgi:imidazole glycerol-phosphate synthase subunit HisF